MAPHTEMAVISPTQPVVQLPCRYAARNETTTWVDDATCPLVMRADADKNELCLLNLQRQNSADAPSRRAVAAIRVGVHRALATPPPY